MRITITNNITAVISGFLKFYEVGIISSLPKIIGVQSAHADPVYQYYQQPDDAHRRFVPQNVRPSVAQAAMIGNPVSMPRVIELERQYNQLAGRQRVFFIQVSEQQIMDWQLRANRNGHIACTHGGECLAGLKIAVDRKIAASDETAVVDSTAHALKFAGFQDLYFADRMPADFEVVSDPALINAPVYMHPEGLDQVPAPGKPLTGRAFEHFVQKVTQAIAEDLKLTKTTAA